MKKILFSILTVVSVIFLASCEKHKLVFDMDKMPEDWAEFQLHYMEAIPNVTANNFDTTLINGDIYSSATGSGTLYPYNGIPSGGAGSKFFGVKSGPVHIQLYRGGVIAYDQTVTLKPGKQNVVIYDMTKEPFVYDNEYPYWNRTAPSSVTNWNTDSVFKVRFFNFLFETPGVPYRGKLQYQYQRVGNILDPITGQKIANEPSDWYNMGEPVGFGESTGYVTLVMHKQTFNSSGTQRFNYRILDDAGNILEKWNGSRFVDYSDYWNAYIGRVYIHFFRGCRASTPVCNVSQWVSL